MVFFGFVGWQEVSVRFVRGSILAVVVLVFASLTQIRGKSSPSPHGWTQSNSGAPLVWAVSDPQAHSSSVIPNVNISFTTITVPGAAFTGIWGINKSGEIVGNYGQNINCSCDSHGFSFQKGTFSYFDYPGQTVTVPSGINDSGLIVGYAGTGILRGFLYNGVTFTTLRDGGDSATIPWGINNTDAVVGGAGTLDATRGFELRGKTYKSLSPPGTYTYAYATGINSLGQVVGWTDFDGFIYSNGKFATLDFPGASKTEAWRINDSDMTVGWYDTNGPPYMIYAFARGSNGKFISFGYPGALTFAFGVNATGQIVGEYTFDSQTYYGFVTSPVTPADFH